MPFRTRARKFAARCKWAVYDAIGKAKDAVNDRVLEPKLTRLKASAAYNAVPKQRILVVGVQTVRRAGSIDRIFATMSRSLKHELVLDLKDVGGIGKLENINILVRRHNIQDFDWIWMIDDDVELPDDFTDVFVALCTLQDYRIAQPAHRAWSYLHYESTKRQRGMLAHQTNWVEVGPVTAFHKSVFDIVFPLPDLRFGWGVDFYWAAVLSEKGLPMGVVDAAALRHTSPIANTYASAEAQRESDSFLDSKGVGPQGAPRTLKRISEIG